MRIRGFLPQGLTLRPVTFWAALEAGLIGSAVSCGLLGIAVVAVSSLHIALLAAAGVLAVLARMAQAAAHQAELWSLVLDTEPAPLEPMATDWPNSARAYASREVRVDRGRRSHLRVLVTERGDRT
jgi:hypothetical protein